MHPVLAKYSYEFFLRNKKKPVFEYLEVLEKSQYYPLSQLRDLQLKRLREIVKYAYQNVVYYKEEFDKIKFSPDQIKSLDDIQKLPILTKEIIQSRFKELITQNPRMSHYVNFTSGSTGTASKFARDVEAAAWYWAAEFRGPGWHGWKIGDKYAFFWGTPLDKSKRIKERTKDFFLNRIRYSAHDRSDGLTEAFYKRCLRFKPKFFWGYPSTIYQFAKSLNDKNLDGRALDIKFIKTSSEMLYPFQRELLESTFRCKLYNDYGACEVGHIAFECPNGKMHLAIENFCIEILDHNNKPSKNGSTGKVVFTNLINYAMPLIRYEIGDRACLSDKICSCGRSLPVLSELNGRIDDVVIDENGDEVHDSILGYIIRDVLKKAKLDAVKQIKFVQRAKNELIVQIVKGPNFSDSIIDYLRRGIHKQLGSSFKIIIDFPGEIIVEKSGKFRYFVSELPRS